jgi:hypothetical protein
VNPVSLYSITGAAYYRRAQGKESFMSVSEQDREDYEEGLRDRGKGIFDQALNDVTVNHPDTEAYYKGRRGEQLDEDEG